MGRMIPALLQCGRSCRAVGCISERCEVDSNKGRHSRTRAHTRTHVRTRARVHVRTQTHTRARTRTHVRTRARVRARMHTRRGIRSKSKHCCGADGAAGRWCILTTAVTWFQ